MKKNILIATGGTGGHIIPALVFHEQLKKKYNIFISTDTRGLNFINNKGYKINIIETPRIFNNFLLIPFKLIMIFFLTIKSIFLLKKNNINFILSTGGYAPIPLCLAGLILKNKLIIFEPNQVIGKSNIFFLNYCKRILCYNKNLKKFPKKFKSKIMVISPMVRKIFYKKLKKKDKQFKILIIGGSQGAKLFDKFLHNAILTVSKRISLKVIHQTQKNNIRFLKNFYSKNSISNHVFNFEKNLFKFIKNSDFCITRAGASVLSELFVLKIPFLAIPLPDSKDNHQLENAKYYEKRNSCWVENEKFLGEKKIIKILENIFFSKKKDFLVKKKTMIRLNKNLSWKRQNKIILSAFYEI